MAEKTQEAPSEIALIVRKWKNKRGSLIMMLHDIQDQRGYVPRESALELAKEVDVPLARIYEVLTFYNYFKLESPGKVVISVCTGTACHLKGADAVLDAFKNALGLEENETDPKGGFHIQSVRCVGCCVLAPVVVVNGKTYGKVKPAEVPKIIGEWREFIEQETPQEGGR